MVGQSVEDRMVPKFDHGLLESSCHFGWQAAAAQPEYWRTGKQFHDRQRRVGCLSALQHFFRNGCGVATIGEHGLEQRGVRSLLALAQLWRPAQRIGHKGKVSCRFFHGFKVGEWYS